VPTSSIALGDPSLHAGVAADEAIRPPQDFLGMLNQADFSDITLIVDGNPIYCHQVILASRSLYFEALFSHDFKEKEQRVVNFS